MSTLLHALQQKQKRLCLSIVLLLLAALLCLAAPENAMATESINVTLYAADAKSTNGSLFVALPMELTLEDGIAERYGYAMPESATLGSGGSITVDYPTFFDALVAAHAELFGADFSEDPTSYLEGTGFMLKSFGQFDASVGFAINHQYPLLEEGWGAAADTAKIEDGDVLVLFRYTSPMLEDYYAFFDQDSLTVEEGEEFTLTLKGYSYMMSGYLAPEGDPLAEAEIYLVDPDTGLLQTNVALEDIPLTNENGQVSMKFDEAGEYLVSALCSGPNGEQGSLPLCQVTVEEKEAAAPVAAQLSLSMQAENTYTLVPQKVTVSSDLAESYGYTDTVSGSVSALDALVKAHQLLFLTDYTAEEKENYLKVENGTIKTMMGVETTVVSFVVNGDFPYDPESSYSSTMGYTGYMINQAPVADGDFLDFFFYQDTSMYMDYYTWFEDAEGQRMDGLTVKAGEEFTLGMKGFLYMLGGPFVGEDRVKQGDLGPIKGAELVLSDALGNWDAFDPQLLTDANGQAALRFDQAGTYYLSAISGENLDLTYSDYFDPYITSPWLPITVEEEDVPLLFTINGETIDFQFDFGINYKAYATVTSTDEYTIKASGKSSHFFNINGSNGMGSLEVKLTPPESGEQTVCIVVQDTSTTAAASRYYLYVSLAKAEEPSITADLPSEATTYTQNAEAAALSVTASVSDGGQLSYQWYSSSDNLSWTKLIGETNASYTPVTTTIGTTYYKVEVTNTLNGLTATKESALATVTVEEENVPVVIQVNSEPLNFTHKYGQVYEAEVTVAADFTVTVTGKSSQIFYINSTSGTGKVEETISPNATGTRIVRVIAQDGATAGVGAQYFIYASRPYATLASISPSGLTHTPSFAPENFGPYALGSRTASQGSFSLKAAPSQEGSTVTAKYTDNTGAAKEVVLSASSNKSISGLKAGRNSIELVVSPAENSGYQPGVYTLTIDRAVGLKSLSLSGENLLLPTVFSASTTEYSGVMPPGSLTLTPVAQEANNTLITVNGQPLVDGKASVDIASGENTVTVEVTSLDGTATPLLYTYTISGTSADAACSFEVKPADAVVQLYDPVNNLIQPSGSNAYSGLLRGQIYSYTVSKYGYQTARGSITAGTDTNKSVSLESISGGLEEQDAAWKDFRNSDANNGVTKRYTPRNVEETELLWAAKLGSGWSANPSAQILVDDSLVLMAGSNLYKLDLASGEIKAQAAMAGSPSYGYTPPTYGDGMIFVPLGGGKVQAFNAETLESLWLYTDPLGGQALSPITYSDGYIYTGFWTGETSNAAFACISVTDEEPAATNEAKAATWRDVHPGGFYWAGAAVVGDAIIYGGDNGQSDATSTGSTLVSRNKFNGQLLSSLALSGDQRSSIAYADGQLFFTTKDGKLWKASLSSEGQLSALSSQSYADHGNQSTSTPVIYKGRVYFGLGSGFSGSSNVLAVNASDLSLVWNAEMPAYPQCSVLLSDAYAEDGKIYLYATYNNNPGGVKVIEASTSGTEISISDLYIPEADKQNYCVSSLICNTDGTLYYKNDSGHVFALAARFPIQTSAAHGSISVKQGETEVISATPGTQLSVSVTANTGWKLQSLSLNGEAIPVDAKGNASIRMPGGGAELLASYLQDESGIQVTETLKTRLALSESQASHSAAVQSALEGASFSGLASAADAFIQSLLPNYPDHSLKIETILSLTAKGLALDAVGKITELDVEAAFSYALYLDGAETPSASGSIADSDLLRKISLTLPAPSGMELGAYSRLLHEGSYSSPSVSNNSASFQISESGSYRLLADVSLATVKFYLRNGESGEVQDGESITYLQTDAGKDLPIPSREHYAFLGWYADQNGKGIRYSEVSTELPERLYAVWEYDGSSIEVSFRLIGDWLHDDGVKAHDEYVTWIKTTEYELEEGDTVYDLFILALDDADLSQKGASGNYVSAIRAPEEFGGYWLEEFDNGPNSGWMYSVNGEHPDQGLKSYELEDGDEVIWHYVDDYSKEAESRWTGGEKKYLNRWLEAKDISPAQWLKKYGDVDDILSIVGEGSVKPKDLEDYLGENVSFTFTPAEGWYISDVIVDGDSQGAIEKYKYKDLELGSRIKVIFKEEAPSTPVYFSDLPVSHWAYADVAYLVELGVIQGRPDGTFGAYAAVKRSEFVTMLARMSGDVLPAYSGQFSDVSASAYYASAVAWAIQAGVSNGASASRFSPDRLISRQEMAAMLYRYAQYKAISLPAKNAAVSFLDQSSIHNYALSPVSMMQQAAIITGDPDGSFRPLATATRSEAAAMLARLNQL